MATAPPPAAKKPPPPAPPAPSGGTSERTRKTFTTQRGVSVGAQKVVLYGSGGVGKTTLAAAVTQLGYTPQFIDIEQGSGRLDVARVSPSPENWDDLRDALHSPSIWEGFDCLVIDSLTLAEQWAGDWVVANVKHPEKPDKRITSLESYGFGKGYSFIYDAFLRLLSDLDAHQRAGRQIICIAHDCTEKVPNPGGEDWLQYQPRLQSPPKQGKVREKVKEWADHMFYISFDVAVEKGKGTGGGTRTIYPSELPSHWAKSRYLADPIAYQKDSAELWESLLGSKS